MDTKTRIRLFVALLLVSISFHRSICTASALPTAPVLTLSHAVAIALEKHPSLKRLHEARQAAEAREEIASSDFFPRLTLEAVEKDGPPSAPGFGFSGLVNTTLTRHTGASLVLNQIIYDFGRTLHRSRSSRFAAAAAGADEAAQRAYVVLNVYRAYANVLMAQRMEQVMEKNLAARQLTVKQAQAKFDAGLSSRVDLGLARASLAEAHGKVVTARNELEEAFALLNDAMGVTDLATYLLEDIPANPSLVPPVSASMAQDLETALKHRPELQSMNAQIRSAEETVRALEAGESPILRLLATGGSIRVAPEQAQNNRALAFGLGLSFPLYSGGLVQAQSAEARHHLAALAAQREELVQSIRLQVMRARMNLASLLESREAADEQFRQAQDSVSLATQRYEEGLGSFVELQEAQLAVFTAETNLARLNYDLVTAKAAMEYAVGRLSPDSAAGKPNGP